ncbi:cilia-and flagella-associated protein 96 isoform X2 [Conger conger]|uniref:cilia-and flagella-associated protein 96 isoform X2 n=1 Tax=Conger conger TaxID=82655 RepID=UPI002A5A1B29|nr:cilia-and flagella-associated protein 96 isoform X2 [Conger conger]
MVIIHCTIGILIGVAAPLGRCIVNLITMPPEGKTDMDRVGLFKEMGYITIGDKYTVNTYRPFNESAHKNKQMVVSSPKKKSGLQVGYFDAQFKRIFEKEASTDPVKLRRQYRMQQAKKNIGKAFLPSNGEKKPSGIGSYYGTLGGPVQALSALQVQRKPYQSPGKNVLTSPPKKGSGYGYPNVTLSKRDTYSTDPYDRAREMMKKEIISDRTMMKGGPFRLNLHPRDCFDGNPYKLDKALPPVKNTESKKAQVVPFKPSSPSKRIGGMKAGTFDIYPSHSADPYIARRSKSVTTNKDGKIFHPSPGPKTMPVSSIINVNVKKAINSAKCTAVPSVMAY